MERPVINSDTFSRIFNDYEDILAEMISSLTCLKIEEIKNNITSNVLNPKNYDYIVTMPEDNIIKVKNVKKQQLIIVNLTKK